MWKQKPTAASIERDGGRHPQQLARGAATEEARNPGNGQHNTEDDRRIHDASAVASAIVFIRHFQATDDAGRSSEEREAALKAALPNEVGERLRVLHGMHDRKWTFAGLHAAKRPRESGLP